MTPTIRVPGWKKVCLRFHFEGHGQSTQAGSPVRLVLGDRSSEKLRLRFDVDTECESALREFGVQGSSNPVTPTVFRNEPFGEYVEGLSHLICPHFL